MSTSNGTPLAQKRQIPARNDFLISEKGDSEISGKFQELTAPCRLKKWQLDKKVRLSTTEKVSAAGGSLLAEVGPEKIKQIPQGRLHEGAKNLQVS